MSESVGRPVRGLVVDYGGVLTVSLESAVRAWSESEGVDPAEMGRLLMAWLQEIKGANPVHELEVGTLSAADFEVLLADQLLERGGIRVSPDGLLSRMFAHLSPEPRMTELVRRARAHGVRTALLSNSWGNDYPRQGWSEVFDAIVISSEVGLRKPDPAIYRLASDRLALRPEECVFVDDLPHNVTGAEAVGMIGLHHREFDLTERQVSVALGLTVGGEDHRVRAVPRESDSDDVG